MPVNDYTPRQALTLLLRNIEMSSPQLHQRIMSVIDAGKDVEVAETTRTQTKGKKKARSYRKNVPFDDAEAIGVALLVLESHLIESRRIVKAVMTGFANAANAPAKQRNATDADNRDLMVGPVSELDLVKKVVIEAEPETVQQKQALPDLPLEDAVSTELDGLEDIFDRLRVLLDFTEV
jgi:hypothetical protein